MIKYSIITAAHKQRDKLPKLIESLENQTVKDFELLVCLDGDFDGTEDYLESINPSFPMRILKQKHVGHARLARVINLGIDAAIGEYCVFVMGDSFLEQNYLEVLDGYADPERILCGIRIQIDNGKGVEMDYRLKKYSLPTANVLLVREPYQLITGNGLTIPTHALREYGGWDDKIEGYGGEDNEIVARLYYKGITVWSLVDARLYHFWHKGTESKNNSYVADLVNEYAR